MRIMKLHRTGSKDWQSLSKQVIKNYKPLAYNFPQMFAAMATKKFPWIFLEWARGTGKTTFLGHHTRECVSQMPRSNGMLIGPSYQKILTQILPSMIQGLEQQGLFQNLHYFIGRRPPKSWKWQTPYQPPNKFDKYISFWNGAGINLISHDVPGDGRGLNTDFEIGDESALLDKHKLDENTLPTLRGSNKTAFERCHLFASRMHTSSTPLTQKGQWFVEMEEASIKEPNKIKFISADSRMNAHNLRDGYLEDARAVTLPWVYDAEYLNIRPRQIKNGFYPLLDEDTHGYNQFDYAYYNAMGKTVDCRGDQDLSANEPLIVGQDFGAAINCMVVNQHVGNEFRCLKDFYVLGENKQIQSDMVKNFADYYEYHKNKTIYLYFDNTGNNETGITKYTRAEQTANQLHARGWKVRLRTVGGRNPHHYDKYLLWLAILGKRNPRLPEFRINASNARNTFISMRNAGAKQGRNKTVEKDKSSEKSKTIKREHATDHSDAMDAPIYGMFNHLMTQSSTKLPDTLTTAR